jgi:glucokinase
MAVLAGDIGGTKTLLQIADFARNTYRVIIERRYINQAYDDFTAVVNEFMQAAAGRITRLSLTLDAACFGVAGPINVTPTGQHTHLTNLPWTLDSTVLSHLLNIPKVRLINDFQAVGYGIEALAPADFRNLHTGELRPRATRALIGAGTGLGEGLLVWQQDHYEVLAAEGGHVDFAPTDELQIALLRHLMQRFPRVSYERILSGRGLVNLYDFLHSHAFDSTSRIPEPSDPAALTSAALANTDPLANQALDLFISVYGAQAGNLALTVLAAGGVYVAGGIAPKIIDRLADGAFMRAFLNKGRLSPFLATVPVQVIMNPKAGLMGAALAANRL